MKSPPETLEASARNTRLAGPSTATATLTPSPAFLITTLVKHALESASIVVLTLTRHRVQRVTEQHCLMATKTGYDARAGVGGTLATLLLLLGDDDVVGDRGSGR